MIPIRDDAPRYTTPYMNYFLIVINVVVFLFELSLGARLLPGFLYQFGVVPVRVIRFVSLGHEPAALWIFGDNIEDQLGHFRYLLFYLFSGLAASAAHILLNQGSNVPSVGASGAIAGVMGAYFVLFPAARVLTIVPFIFFFTIYLPAWVVLGYWFLAQFLSGAATSIAPSQQASAGIAFWAHVGGFLAGIAMIRIFPTRLRYRRSHLSWQ